MQSTFLVIGLGKTGWSCLKFLKQQGHAVCVIDTRKHPPFLEQLQENYPDIEHYCGIWPESLSQRHFCDRIISPGLNVNDSRLQSLLPDKENTCFIGDIELFARHVSAPVVAVTGSNGKSTVTTLLGAVAQQSGLRVAVGGNVGTPILDLLADDIELYILELSSFQLETTFSLAPRVAILLNTSPDHMDRYDCFDDYQRVKARVFLNSEYQLYHCDETWLTTGRFINKAMTFGASRPVVTHHWGLVRQKENCWLSFEGQAVLSVNSLALAGCHHFDNALAVLAASQLLKLPLAMTKKVICDFKGLAHRCQLIGISAHAVRWFNDSKATNVGATIAAIKTVGQLTKNKVVLLAGGQGKGADFTVLQESVARFVRVVVVFGEDAKYLERSLSMVVNVICVNSLAEAVQTAMALTHAEDSVLFAPACASFDMFENFEARGDAFVDEVKRQAL